MSSRTYSLQGRDVRQPHEWIVNDAHSAFHLGLL